MDEQKRMMLADMLEQGMRPARNPVTQPLTPDEAVNMGAPPQGRIGPIPVRPRNREGQFEFEDALQMVDEIIQVGGIESPGTYRTAMTDVLTKLYEMGESGTMDVSTAIAQFEQMGLNQFARDENTQFAQRKAMERAFDAGARQGQFQKPDPSYPNMQGGL